ncbi:MAG: matrixin family metalloprotease [Myxococcales bacterium]
MPRFSALPLPLGLSGFVLLTASQAGAYCRTTTAEQPPESAGCPGTCVTTGTPLYWPVAKTQYAFNVRPFVGFTDAAVRRIIGASFDTWTAVECPVKAEDGGLGRVSVGLEATAKSGTTTDEVGPQDEEPNDNAIVYFSGDEWIDRGYDPRAFALTSLWFYDSGEIIGADMHFNGAMNFGECPPQGCGALDAVADLQNVATHEAGHYFGLAHSERETATMWCDASPGQVDKRTLSPDDVEGLCDIYPPGKAFTQAPASGGGDDSHCSAAPHAQGNRGLMAWLALLGTVLVGRRRVIRAQARRG